MHFSGEVYLVGKFMHAFVGVSSVRFSKGRALAITMIPTIQNSEIFSGFQMVFD